MPSLSPVGFAYSEECNLVVLHWSLRVGVPIWIRFRPDIPIKHYLCEIAMTPADSLRYGEELERILLTEPTPFIAVDTDGYEWIHKEIPSDTWNFEPAWGTFPIHKKVFLDAIREYTEVHEYHGAFHRYRREDVEQLTTLNPDQIDEMMLKIILQGIKSSCIHGESIQGETDDIPHQGSMASPE